MEEDEDAGRLRRRTTTTRRWERTGADRQVLRRTTTTHRVYSKTTTVEDYCAAPEEAAEPVSSGLQRRQSDYEAAVAVTAGIPLPMVADSRRGDYGRISDAELEEQAINLRAYWAKRLGKKPHHTLEMRLKPMVLEFGLARMREFIDEVAKAVPPEAEAREVLELLFSRMSEARRLRGPKEGKP